MALYYHCNITTVFLFIHAVSLQHHKGNLGEFDVTHVLRASDRYR